MANSGDRGLDNKDVRAGFLRDGPEPFGALRDGTDGTKDSGGLDLFHSLGDQRFFDIFLAINLLCQVRRFFLRGTGDLVENFRRILVPRLDSFKIENRDPAQLAHRDGELHIHHAIHGTGQNWHFDLMLSNLERGIDFVGINRQIAWHQRNVVKPISDSCFPVSSNPHAHNYSSPQLLKIVIQLACHVP